MEAREPRFSPVYRRSIILIHAGYVRYTYRNSRPETLGVGRVGSRGKEGFVAARSAKRGRSCRCGRSSIQLPHSVRCICAAVVFRNITSGFGGGKRGEGDLFDCLAQANLLAADRGLQWRPTRRWIEICCSGSLRRKLTTRWLFIIAPFCKALCVFNLVFCVFGWSEISAGLILRLASPLLVNCVVQRWTLFVIWKMGAVSHRTLLTRGFRRYRLLLWFLSWSSSVQLRYCCDLESYSLLPGCSLLGFCSHWLARESFGSFPCSWCSDIIRSEIWWIGCNGVFFLSWFWTRVRYDF